VSLVAVSLLSLLLADGTPPLAVGPHVDVGTVVFTPTPVDATLVQIDAGQLKLQTCLATPAAPVPAPSTASIADGQVQLQVTIRRGQVKLVTTTSVSEGLEWMTPCLERRLAEWTWPVRTGQVDVPVTVSSEPAKSD